jgi:hypothetical protein
VAESATRGQIGIEVERAVEVTRTIGECEQEDSDAILLSVSHLVFVHLPVLLGIASHTSRMPDKFPSVCARPTRFLALTTHLSGITTNVLDHMLFVRELEIATDSGAAAFIRANCTIPSRFQLRATHRNN